jgi:hypothetical protein
MKTVIIPVMVMALAMLTACGVKTSGVRPLGANTFTISVDDGKETTAKGTALGLAEHHCKEMQKELLVTRIFKRHQNLRYFYDINFQCVEADDPRLQNPEYETIYRSQPE